MKNNKMFGWACYAHIENQSKLLHHGAKIMEEIMFYIRYLGALIYDGIILIALFMLLTAFCLLFRHGVAIPPASYWYQGLLLSLVYGYYFFSYQKSGQTIGMKAWHLKLIAFDAKRIRNKHLLARFFLTLPALLIALFCLKSPKFLLKKWTKSEVVVF